MDPITHHMILPEAAARRLLLVRAIDTLDTHGRLLSAVERDQLEQRALESARDPDGGPPNPRRYLEARAEQLLAVVGHRQPRLAAMQAPDPWRRWLGWLLPLAALLIGAAADRIDNPRQVNLLSPPLLAFLLWNLLIYATLLSAPLWPKRVRGNGLLAAFQRALADLPGRAGSLRAGVTAEFRVLWLRASGTLEGQRWRQLLHTSAVAWAFGVALSIAIGGLVREYRVGWESTLLDLPQVYAFLRVLFAPVVALFPVEGFSLAELERLHFRSGLEVDRAQARRWVGLYIGLLLLVVAVPRTLLGAYAGWRARRLSRSVRIELTEPYFTEVLARVSPAQVTLGLAGPDAPGRAAVLHLLRQLAHRGVQRDPATERWTVLETARGDALRVVDMGGGGAMAAAGARNAPATPHRWLSKWWLAARPTPAQGAQRHAWDRSDVVLFASGSAAGLQEAGPLLQTLGKPVLVLATGGRPDDGTVAALRAAVQRHGLRAEILPLADCAACWAQEPLLRGALARLLPSHMAPGMARLTQAWAQQREERFGQAMRLLAGELMQAARESEEVKAGPLNLRRLVNPAEREAGQQARRQAMEAVLGRLGQVRARTQSELLGLHAAEDGAALPVPRLEDRFVVHEAVDTPQAGMAGAASGAALGATVDLMVGGMTLGAAAALGALVGGGAAYVTAAWKNRTSPAGASLVHLSDEMLQALTEAAVLRYLAVIHHGRHTQAPPQAEWKSEVVAAVEASRERLILMWSKARTAPEEAAAPMATLLQDVTRQVLVRLYGPMAG